MKASTFILFFNPDLKANLPWQQNALAYELQSMNSWDKDRLLTICDQYNFNVVYAITIAQILNRGSIPAPKKLGRETRFLIDKNVLSIENDQLVLVC